MFSEDVSARFDILLLLYACIIYGLLIFEALGFPLLLF